MKFLVVSLLLCFSCFVYANEDNIPSTVQLDSQKTVEAPVKKQSGQDTYEQYCIVCHQDGLAGAPKFRNEQDWKSRLVNKKLDDLVASSIKGLNAMPEKGTCTKCSDDDLKAAITYMLPK